MLRRLELLAKANMTRDPHLAVGVITLLIPICVMIILLLRKKRSYRRAIIGGAIIGVAWRIPGYFLTLVWLNWRTGMNTNRPVLLPSLTEFIASAFFAATLGTIMVSIGKLAEAFLRKARAQAGRPQP